MTLPESEKQKITATVRNITDVFRKEFNVEISTICNVDGSLTLIMGDEYIKVGIRYTVQEFEEIGKFIMRNYPGDLALYFGIYWEDQLIYLHSIYSKKLRQKALKIIDDH
jgi:hypothetical protein